MKDILQEIVAFKRIEVEQQKQIVSPRDLYARVECLMPDTVSDLPEQADTNTHSVIIIGTLNRFKKANLFFIDKHQINACRFQNRHIFQ